jgi:Sulfotransferase family
MTSSAGGSSSDDTEHYVLEEGSNKLVDERLGEPQPVFPFFVGAGRSGTTLLRAMFDSHPEMAVPNETRLIVRLARDRARYDTPDGFDIDEFWKDVVVLMNYKPWDLTAEEVREALAPGVSGYAGAIRSLYEFYARREGKRRYGNKTPGFVTDLPMLAELFPEAKFVHLIRDGRDVVLSHLDIDTWGPSTLGEAAAQWARHVRKGMNDGGALGPSRYMEVHYEALLENPEATLEGLCRWLELAYDDAMLRYFERADRVAGDTPHFRNIYRPPTKGLRDWRAQMAAEDVEQFEALAGDVLTAAGYELVREKPVSRRRSLVWRLGVLGRVLRVRATLLLRRIRGKGRSKATKLGRELKQSAASSERIADQ